MKYILFILKWHWLERFSFSLVYFSPKSEAKSHFSVIILTAHLTHVNKIAIYAMLWESEIKIFIWKLSWYLRDFFGIILIKIASKKQARGKLENIILIKLFPLLINAMRLSINFLKVLNKYKEIAKACYLIRRCESLIKKSAQESVNNWDKVCFNFIESMILNWF